MSFRGVYLSITSKGALIHGKLYGRGKCRFFSQGPAEYGDIAADAFLRSTQAYCCLNRELFRSILQRRGVPENIIEKYLSSYTLDDEIYLHPDG